jgi:xylulokinase
VSFGINDGLQVLKESGTRIEQCSLVGGGARSPFWAQLLADILAMPVVTHKGGETGGALGAARLACLAAGNRWPPSVKNRRSGRPGAPRLNAITP